MSAIEHPSAVEQEQARQALNALRDVKPSADTFDVTVAGTSESPARSRPQARSAPMRPP